MDQGRCLEGLTCFFLGHPGRGKLTQFSVNRLQQALGSLGFSPSSTAPSKRVTSSLMLGRIVCEDSIDDSFWRSTMPSAHSFHSSRVSETGLITRRLVREDDPLLHPGLFTAIGLEGAAFYYNFHNHVPRRSERNSPLVVSR